VSGEAGTTAGLSRFSLSLSPQLSPGTPGASFFARSGGAGKETPRGFVVRSTMAMLVRRVRQDAGGDHCELYSIEARIDELLFNTNAH
jgi:hypothetical protein